MPDASPELSVVCKNCGSEVSPYVTECPYCGTRLRKRAPKLERHGDGLQPQETRRSRRHRRAAERRLRREIDGAPRRRLALATERPYATIAAILVPSALVIVQRASGLTLDQLGAVLYPSSQEAWRYLTAPWVYDNVGYLFAVGLALAIFVPTLERRLGMVPTALLLIACGALGMLAAVGIDKALGDGSVFAAGGNGVALGALCCWLAIRHADAVADPADGYDAIAVAVAAAVLLLLPAFVDLADPWAGIAGGVVGLAAGAIAARLGVAGE